MAQWTWDRFAATARLRGEAIALRQGDASITFAELCDLAETLSASIAIAPGERAVVCAENSIPVAATILAIWRRGGVPVLVNSRAPESHVRHALDKSGAQVGFADEGIAPLDPRLRLFPAAADSARGSGSPEHGRAGTAAGSIVFTSGSTGLPKGVVQPAANLIDGAERVARLMGYGDRDVILCPVPFAFDYGWGQFLSMAMCGIPLVLPNEPNGFALCAAIAHHRPTVLASVPSVLSDLLLGLAPIAETDCSSIRLITNTGSKIPAPVLDQVHVHFPDADLSLNYGLTETYRSSSLPFALARTRPNSIGRPIEGVEIRILREDGTVADVGEVGELCHLGAGVFAGYWEEPVLTDAVRQEFPAANGGTVMGVRTGDYGFFDAEGLLYLEGRRDRLVKCMGIRVSLAEIEDMLYRTGLLHEAAVVAVDHDIFGSFIAAHIVPAPGKAAEGDKALVKAVRKAVRDVMSNYMQPRQYSVYSSLPKTGSGKFDLARLKQMTADSLQP